MSTRARRFARGPAPFLVLGTLFLWLVFGGPGSCGPPRPPAPTYPRYERAPEGRVYKITLDAAQQEQQTLLDEGTEEELAVLKQVWPHDWTKILNDRRLKELYVQDTDGELTWTYDVAFFPDAGGVVACGLHGAIAFDVPDLGLRWKNFDISTCWALAVDPRGRWVAVGRPKRGTVLILDPATGAVLASFDADTNGVDMKGAPTNPSRDDDLVTHLSFSADGEHLLVTTRGDQHVWVYRTADWSLEMELNGDCVGEVSLADFTPDGKRVVVVAGLRLRVFDLQTGQVVAEPHIPGAGDVGRFRWLSEDEALFLVGDEDLKRSGLFYARFDVDSGRTLAGPSLWRARSSDFEAHRGRGILAEGSDSREFAFRRLDDFRELWFVQLPSYVHNLALSPDGSLALAVSGGDQFLLFRTPDLNDPRWQGGGQ